MINGWINDPDEVGRVLALLPRPYFDMAAAPLLRSGTAQTTLLYKAFKEVNGGHYIDYPAIASDDCVSRAFGLGVDLLDAVQIALGHTVEDFRLTATEPIHALARVEVGGGRHADLDGAVGAWGARAVSMLGTLTREDVGAYDGGRAREWGRHGLPEWTVLGLRRMVRTASLVTAYEELEDALANGYPVVVCSDQGFTLQRNVDGFCAPRGTWAHSMLIVGVRADHRPGACCFQSWAPDVPHGPIALDQPPNSFWADRHIVERMLAMHDSWAISNFEGFPVQYLPPHWCYADFI